MNTKTFKIITLLLLLVVSLSATVLKQQGFESSETDTWNYVASPATYYNLVSAPNYAVWGRDNDLPSGEPNPVIPLPDAGAFVWNAENTENQQPGILHTLSFTQDLSGYTGDLSVNFYYYTLIYGNASGTWSTTNDVLNYYVEYDNGTNWDTPIALNMGTNAWVKISINIPNASSHVRLRFEVKNNTWQEIAAFDLITLESTDPASPITLSDFSAKALNTGIKVTWSTASEKENSGFKLYRDGDMIAFIDGAGTSTETNAYSYFDKTVVPGQSYTYMLADVSYAGIENIFESDAVTVLANAASTANACFNLETAYPNPFNPSTSIDYSLTETQDVELSIFNMKGELQETLFSGEKTAGQYSQTWNAGNVQSGVYILRARFGNTIQTQKLVLVK